MTTTYDGDLITYAIDGDQWWSAKAMAAIKALAATGEPFTVYAITQDPYGVDEPPHANYFGSIVSLAKAQGLIKIAGYLPSPRPTRKGGVCRAWIGTAA